MSRVRPPRPEPIADGRPLAASARLPSHPMYTAPTSEARQRARHEWDTERRKLLEIDLAAGPGKSKGLAAKFIRESGA